MSEQQSSPALQATVQEVQAWFPGNDALQRAIDKLTLAGWDRAQLSIPEEAAFRDPTTATPSDVSEAPDTPIDHQQIRTLNTGMAGYAGAVVAAGAAIATGVGAAVAVPVAAAAGIGAAALSEGIGQVADQAQVSDYNRRGTAGTLVLAVHVRDQGQADEAMRILRENGATEVKPVTRTDEALTGGVSASGWTG